MKTLLSTLGTVIIAGSIPALVVNNSDQINQTDTLSQSVDWDKGNNVETSVATGASQVATKHYWYTFRLISKDYRTMALENSDGFSFSWGNTRYGTWYFNTQSIHLDKSTNAKIASDNYKLFLQFTVYDETVQDFLAKMHGIVKVGYAWYQEDGNDYFQFIVHQYISSINSATGGANFANIGTGLSLEY